MRDCYALFPFKKTLILSKKQAKNTFYSVPLMSDHWVVLSQILLDRFRTFSLIATCIPSQAFCKMFHFNLIVSTHTTLQVSFYRQVLLKCIWNDCHEPNNLWAEKVVSCSGKSPLVWKSDLKQKNNNKKNFSTFFSSDNILYLEFLLNINLDVRHPSLLPGLCYRCR